MSLGIKSEPPWVRGNGRDIIASLILHQWLGITGLITGQVTRTWLTKDFTCESKIYNSID